jgi:hypothetical protein
MADCDLFRSKIIPSLYGYTLEKNFECCDNTTTTCVDQRITKIYMPQYQLGGWLPKELVAFDQLEQLVLRDNQLKDILPSDLSRLKKLRYLELQNNSFTGIIPPAWEGMIELRDLQLNDNQLRGTVPTEFTRLPNLTQFIVHNNMLQGEMIPSRVNESFFRFAPQRPDTTSMPPRPSQNGITFWGTIPAIVVACSFFVFVAIFVGLYSKKRRKASVSPLEECPKPDLERFDAESCDPIETSTISNGEGSVKSESL